MKHNLKIGDQLPNMIGKYFCTTAYPCFGIFGKHFSDTEKGALIIRDFRKIGDDDCVVADYRGYLGDNYYIFKIKDIPNIKIQSDIGITPSQAQNIINIACSAWKSKLADLWAKNIVISKNISISNDFYKEMRKACTAEQHELFDKIFGKEKKDIDFDKLKIGSKVKIKHTEQHCGGIEELDLEKDVDIVFFKSKHSIGDDLHFSTTSDPVRHYITFHQNGKYALFLSSTDIDYIVEVIKY